MTLEMEGVSGIRHGQPHINLHLITSIF